MITNFDWYARLDSIQVDISSYCNAKCSCTRHCHNGDKIPNLSLDHFDLQLWNKLWGELADYDNVKHLTLNGNWGDPMMHPQLLEMLECVYDNKPDISVLISTNASLRTEKWWSELANQLKDKKHLIEFAIDGIGEDVHSIYRKNTSYEKIIKNMTAFIEHGGSARWITTLFNYNLFQKIEMIDIAREMGCVDIKFRQNCAPDATISNSVSKSDAGKYIFKNIEYVPGKHSSIPTACEWYNYGEIQIDPWGNVFPCCNMSTTYVKNENENNEIYDMIDTVNIDMFNLKHNTLEDILKYKWLTTTLPEKLASDKPYTMCTIECGDLIAEKKNNVAR